MSDDGTGDPRVRVIMEKVDRSLRDRAFDRQYLARELEGLAHLVTHRAMFATPEEALEFMANRLGFELDFSEVVVVEPELATVIDMWAWVQRHRMGE